MGDDELELNEDTTGIDFSDFSHFNQTLETEMDGFPAPDGAYSDALMADILTALWEALQEWWNETNSESN